MWVVSLLAIPGAAVSNPIQQHALKASEEKGRNLLGLGQIGATKDFSSPIHPHVLKESEGGLFSNKEKDATKRNDKCVGFKRQGGCEKETIRKLMETSCDGYCELQRDRDAAADDGMCAGAFALKYCDNYTSWINQKCKDKHGGDNDSNYCIERKIRVYMNSSTFINHGQFKSCEELEEIPCRGQARREMPKCDWISEEKRCQTAGFYNPSAGYPEHQKPGPRIPRA